MGVKVSRRDVLSRATGLVLAAPFLGLAACDEAEIHRRATTLAGATMGTRYIVRIASLPLGIDAHTLRAEFERLLETVNDQMSNWRAVSEISRFNAGPASSWLEISPDTSTVVDEALGVSRLSGGAFDPTIGPLVDLWGFGPGSAARGIPPRARIEAALATMGFRHVRTKRVPVAIAKGQAGIEVDLSGIAKGFGVDKLAEHLDRKGISDYLVEIGGELRARGHSPLRRPWRIGVERPAIGRRAIQRIVGLDRGAIATSGNYRIFFNSEGRRYSHIIDPRNGEPVAHELASVTVVAPSTMQADAWSTALMVLGPEAGLRLARRENIAALFIVKDGRRFAEIASPRFERYGFG